MPLYNYRCLHCNHMVVNVEQRIKDKPLVRCPECRKHKLQRVISAPYVFVKGEPTTIGQLADRNTSSMSQELIDKKEEEYQQSVKESKKVRDEDGNVVFDPDENKAWHHKQTPLSQDEFNKFKNPKDVERYVMEGKKK